MTKDKIIEIARQAGIVFDDKAMPFYMAFAKLVAAKEREACAALVEREWSTNQEKALCDELASYIRARDDA